MTQKTSAPAPENALPQDDNILKAAKLKKLAAFEAAGGQACPHKFNRTHRAGDLQDTYAGLENRVETEDRVTIAGRIMAMRNNGMSIDLHDASGKIQVFCHANNQNQVLKRLAIITIVLTFPVLIASLFGMNVRSGFEHSPYAF